jgi:ferritin-like metal-binding protein YciE
MTTTRELLIFRLQEHYGFLRDILPLLDTAHQRAASEALRALLQTQREGIRGELDTLERALNLLGAQYRMERSAAASGVREAMARFQAQAAPTPEHYDIAVALDLLKLAQLAIAAYQGNSELVQAIGESDVVKLLEENIQREQDGLTALRDLAPRLISDAVNREFRQAA